MPQTVIGPRRQWCVEKPIPFPISVTNLCFRGNTRQWTSKDDSTIFRNYCTHQQVFNFGKNLSYFGHHLVYLWPEIWPKDVSGVPKHAIVSSFFRPWTIPCRVKILEFSKHENEKLKVLLSFSLKIYVLCVLKTNE